MPACDVLCLCDELCATAIADSFGMDDTDEETVAVDRKRVRRDFQKRLEKDEPGAKLKKKTRVLVEVKSFSKCKMLSHACISWG